MDKIKRAIEIHRTMATHQMALRIVELEDALELAEEAVRAKQQAVPEGWQLVPVEPTADMTDAGEDTFIPTYTGTPVSCPIDVYRAMLAAAPKLEGGEA